MQVEPDPAGNKGVNDLYLGGLCALRGCFFFFFLNRSSPTMLVWCKPGIHPEVLSKANVLGTSQDAWSTAIDLVLVTSAHACPPTRGKSSRGSIKDLSTAIRGLVSSNTGTTWSLLALQGSVWGLIKWGHESLLRQP